MGAGVESPRHRVLGDVRKGLYLRRSALVREVYGLDEEYNPRWHRTQFY